MDSHPAPDSTHLGCRSRHNSSQQAVIGCIETSLSLLFSSRSRWPPPAARSGNTAAGPVTEPLAPIAATQDPGTREITIVESSNSITLQKWGEGEPYLSAPADYYENYDWDTSPTTERPAFISGVVEHRSLSENVGIRGLSITTLAPRGEGETSHGFSTGFLWSSDPNDTPMGNPQPWPFATAKEVSVVTGDLFTPYLVFQSHSAFEGTALVMAIVDYEQAEFEMDGISGYLHEFKTLPGRSLAVPVNFGDLAPGAHDIQLVLFDDPYSGYGRDDIETALRSTTEFNLLRLFSVPMRVRVIVGGDETPARAISIQASGQAPPPDVNPGQAAFFARPAATHPMREENQMSVDEGEAGGEYNFRIWTSRFKNMGDATQALMLFLDFQQIPFNGDTVHIADLKAGEEVVIDTSITLPDLPGDHQLIGMVMYDPYRNLGERFELSDQSHRKLVINAR
ncbi:MAG: hypothetical protein IIB28_09540 [Chloroflexi bacterium]|nr:hypothetical protein [Chloroflexota bacterium]